ncbi:hypothetical protein C7H19_07630 [Aphanothece hegewaldii CCALA 016]|uniref:histidine kinase n=1 Tax=Aphanothece hegewaldii CCALA 016 TaxID=2107694 RepID=A0A2T1LZL8_9CHRO|nr:ATP-binding protein [Aphanothece hegewaldii]PSF37846.1 hypothetical protein C7H19_07630 [Aphanothece hegewaldii CCALA 016]
MESNKVYKKFQRNRAQIAQFYQQITNIADLSPELLTESVEELTVALEELNVAQEELLQQNQELEQARIQVEVERKRYQDLFESAPDGYLVTDGAGIIQQANLAATELLKVPQQYLVGKPLTIFIPTQERPIFRSKLNKLLEEAKISEWELNIKPRWGEMFTAAITISVLHQQENGSVSWLWLIRNISDRKHAEFAVRKMQVAETANHILAQELRVQQRLETALRQSDSRFRYIFEAVGVSIWEEDFSQVKAVFNKLKAQGVEDFRQYFTEHPDFVSEMINRIQILDVNSMTVQMFEAENKEQLLGSLGQIFLPETVEIFIEQLLAMAANCTLFSGETVVKTLKGKLLNVLFTIRFPEMEESSDQVIVTLLDISDRKKSELLLQEQSEDLQQLNTSLTQTTQLLSERNQELDRFVYIVSHDLKAPLRAITNLSTWIAEDLSEQLNEDNFHNMTLLQQRVQRMEDLIDGLLVYSRVGRNDTTSQTVDVNELLDEILDSLAPPSTFTIVIQNNLPTLNTKRLLLSQIFSNLISNAIKHHDRPNGRIEIAAIDQQQYYQFSVADDGPGIAPENYERVFDIFQTLKASTNNENTGIGLSIVKKILESEGGNIWLESFEGQGTTFYFHWPR